MVFRKAHRGSVLCFTVEYCIHFQDLTWPVLLVSRGISLHSACTEQSAHRLLRCVILHVDLPYCVSGRGRHLQCVVESVETAQKDARTGLILTQWFVMLADTNTGTNATHMLSVSAGGHPDLLPQFLQLLLDGMLIVECLSQHLIDCLHIIAVCIFRQSIRLSGIDHWDIANCILSGKWPLQFLCQFAALFWFLLVAITDGGTDPLVEQLHSPLDVYFSAIDWACP